MRAHYFQAQKVHFRGLSLYFSCSCFQQFQKEGTYRAEPKNGNSKLPNIMGILSILM